MQIILCPVGGALTPHQRDFFILLPLNEDKNGIQKTV